MLGCESGRIFVVSALLGLDGLINPQLPVQWLPQLGGDSVGIGLHSRRLSLCRPPISRDPTQFSPATFVEGARNSMRRMLGRKALSPFLLDL